MSANPRYLFSKAKNRAFDLQKVLNDFIEQTNITTPDTYEDFESTELKTVNIFNF